ncbi:MAG: hypothetical protein ACREAY_02250, partial [Nitrososphaera sp.]|uniref:hypothetical protein n=1 Tax=Nitrososphaera sp. TaxID=1971748 RepID=UPI003D6EE686
MPTKLTTTIAKAALLPNRMNAEIAKAYLDYMRQNGSSERHQNNQLKTAVVFAVYLGPDKTFLEIRKKDEIITFLDTKIKSEAEDPEKKWITTWNDYLHRLKRFFRWLHSQYGKEDSIDEMNWETPEFVRVKQKRTKRLSPYSETDIWDRDELLT